MARPRINLEDKVDQIVALCNKGHSDEEIARAIGIGTRSMANLRKRHRWLAAILDDKPRRRIYTKRKLAYWAQHGGGGE